MNNYDLTKMKVGFYNFIPNNGGSTDQIIVIQTWQHDAFITKQSRISPSKNWDLTSGKSGASRFLNNINFGYL